MKALWLLALLCLCMTCEAGWVILRALSPAMKAGLKFAGKTEAEAKKIVTALANGNLGKTFGFQESEAFFDHYVIREGGMYLATNVAAGGAVAAVVIVGVGVGAQAAVVREADAKESASISRKMNDMMRSSIFWSSMLNSLSLASVARDNERTSLSKNLDTQLASVQAAIDEATAPPVPLASTDERNVFHQTFAVRSDSIAGITPTPASVVRSVSNIPDISITSDAPSIYKRGSPSTPVVTTGIAPLPPGTPFAMATGISKRNYVPAEFPTYNLELCENDLVAMHLQANVLVVDTPTKILVLQSAMYPNRVWSLK